MILRVIEPNFKGEMYVNINDVIGIFKAEDRTVVFMKGITGKIQVSPDHLCEGDPLYQRLLQLRDNH